MRWLSYILFLSVNFSVVEQSVFADTLTHQVIRRIVVFPIYSDIISEDKLIDSWWAIRKELTRNNFYFLASKNFLFQKNVFKSRKNISPSDAVILTKYLDAQILMLFSVQKRVIKLKVYSSQRGDLIWSGGLKLFNYLSVRDQVLKSALKLTKRFSESVPYNSFTMYNSIKQRVVMEYRGSYFLDIFINTKNKPKIGSNIQIFNLEYKNFDSLLLGGGREKILAEGKIREIFSESARVELLRYSELSLIKENTAVRINSSSYLKSKFSGNNKLKNININELVSFEKNKLSEKEKENQPFYSSLLFILSIFTFIVVGF